MSGISGMEWAGIITSLTASLVAVFGLLGKATHYVVTLVLDAYKGQTKATLEAKDRELASMTTLLAKQEAEITRLHGVVSEVHGIHKLLETILSVLRARPSDRMPR